MTSERAARGAACESIAALFLEAHGLEVLARNLRCKAGNSTWYAVTAMYSPSSKSASGSVTTTAARLPR